MKASDTLHLLLEAQGEIHPGWNAEYLDAMWVRKIAEEALKQIAIMEQQLENHHTIFTKAIAQLEKVKRNLHALGDE